MDISKIYLPYQHQFRIQKQPVSLQKQLYENDYQIIKINLTICINKQNIIRISEINKYLKSLLQIIYWLISKLFLINLNADSFFIDLLLFPSQNYLCQSINKSHSFHLIFQNKLEEDIHVKIKIPKGTPHSKFNPKIVYCLVSIILSFGKNYESIERMSKQWINLFISIGTDFITAKSQIFMRVDNDIEQKIKKKMRLKKMNSKMSIFSMQKVKLRLSRTKSSFKLSNARFNSMNLISALRNTKSRQKFLCNVSEDSRKRNNISLGVSQTQAFRQYLKLVLLNHPKEQVQRKTELFSRNLINYFISVQQSQLLKELKEIKCVSGELINMLSSTNHEPNLSVLRTAQRDISKLLLNMCTQIHIKKKRKVDYDQLIRLNKDIQYISRRLKFFKLTLLTLLDLGQLYCDQMEYENAFQEYTNVVKLAIFMNNKYYEEMAIDKLGICKYYMGDSVSALYFHNNLQHISHFDLNRVKTEYSNQNQIKRLIEEKNQCKPSKNYLLYKNRKINSKRGVLDHQKYPINQSNSQQIEVGQFTFEKQNRNEFYPIINNTEMKSNLKKLIKMPQLKQKVFILKKNLQKNDSLGTKRYCGQTYMIPSANCMKKQNNFQMNEVCVSHRSFNRHNTMSYSQKIDRESKLLVTVINYFLNQSFIRKQL